MILNVLLRFGLLKNPELLQLLAILGNLPIPLRFLGLLLELLPKL